MRKILILLLPFLLFGANLKILSIKQDSNTINVKFNNKISNNDFLKSNMKGGIYYDIKAELTVPKKIFKLENAQITIAQNNKTTTRIVIISDKINNVNVDIKNKTFKLAFKNNKELIGLFKSLDEDSNKSTTSKKKPKKVGDKDDNTKSPLVISAPEISSNINNKHRVVVLDPGHGGKDCGAIMNNICEKTLTLNIAKKAFQELKNRGYKVYITRNSDKYISLRDRTDMANEKNADIFVSIHINSLDKKSKNYKTASGIETYFLSTARSERARKVAEAENKDNIEVMNYFSKLSFLNSINSQRLLASNKLAIDVQSGMLLSVRNMYKDTLDGGVREGPFWVLAGALMPSILIEAGYITNNTDLARLRNKEYQDALAKGIANGIDGYFLKNF